MPAGTRWTRDEHLIALRLYMRTPFGCLHGERPATHHHVHVVVRTLNWNGYGKDLLRQHHERHLHPH